MVTELAKPTLDSRSKAHGLFPLLCLSCDTRSGLARELVPRILLYSDSAMSLLWWQWYDDSQRHRDKTLSEAVWALAGPLGRHTRYIVTDTC